MILVAFAKKLRKNITEAEKLLWSRLKTRQFHGLKFRRQQPIEQFIVDFMCYEKRIVIELDGGQHADISVEDRERDRVLSEYGYKVLRIWKNEIFSNLSGVLEVIENACLSPSPSPPPVEGGGKPCGRGGAEE